MARREASGPGAPLGLVRAGIQIRHPEGFGKSVTPRSWSDSGRRRNALK
jgi:hypothetical protein